MSLCPYQVFSEYCTSLFCRLIWETSSHPYKIVMQQESKTDFLELKAHQLVKDVQTGLWKRINNGLLKVTLQNDVVVARSGLRYAKSSVSSDSKRQSVRKPETWFLQKLEIMPSFKFSYPQSFVIQSYTVLTKSDPRTFCQEAILHIP